MPSANTITSINLFLLGKESCSLVQICREMSIDLCVYILYLKYGLLNKRLFLFRKNKLIRKLNLQYHVRTNSIKLGIIEVLGNS